MHVCMMHTSIILDPDTFVYDACIYDAANLSFDPDTYIHDVYDAHIYDPRSLILIHACMMHLSMFCACVYDAHIYDPGP